MESLFSMDETAQQTAMLLRSRLAPKLQPNDFQEVLKVYDHFVLVKLNKHGSKRFGGAQQVAVSMRSMTNHTPLLRRPRKSIRDTICEAVCNLKGYTPDLR